MVNPLTADDPASLGGFRLAGRLGEGGQGVVYLAHSAAGEPVAIKLLSTGDKATRARLARELDALASIASFCTARVLAASTDGPRPFVVSEFVDGPSLAERVDERGPLSGGELERLVVGTATALAAIHAAGIVHRDFKPANVLLGPDGPRVVDFGIARAEGPATVTSGLIGTPAYLAPEQINGCPVAPASDVFAWAATMVYAATGTSPFGADTVPAVLHRVLNAEPDLSALPPRLRGLIASCLAKDPSRRPTAQHLMVSLVNPNTSPPLAGTTHKFPAPPVPASWAPQPTRRFTGPQGPAPSARRGRGPLLAVGTAVIVLGAAGATAYLLHRPPAADGNRSTTQSSPGTPSPPAQTMTATEADRDLKIPASFEGDWWGHTTSTNPLDTEEADNTVTLNRGKSSAAWTEDNADGGCVGTIFLTEVEPDRLTFSLGENAGDCVPGTIWLTRRGDKLIYTWRDVPGSGRLTQTGTLSKN